PQGTKPVFRVHFTDGATVECCDEHLWFTTTSPESRRPGGTGSVKALAQIRETLRVAGEPDRLNHRIPLVEPIEFAPRENPLQLSPYLLGLLLGDGSLRGESVSFDWTEAELSPQLASQPSRSDDVSVDGLRMRPSASTNPIRRSQTTLALEHYGLYGLSSLEKFIPDDYLFGTVQERLDLIRGLFDTDGHVIAPGWQTVECPTSSP